MEKTYSTITKILIVCIVATIVCTIIRVNSLDVIIDATDELGNMNQLEKVMRMERLEM